MLQRYKILFTAQVANREDQKSFRYYISLILLFVPPLLFLGLLFLYKDHSKLDSFAAFPFIPWQFYMIAICGIIGTIGGALDWKYHRDPLNMKIPPKREMRKHWH